ncbi:hypothetical protein C2I18_14715 [Paenibacillus sp. PK3_47]|uniref:hypothetical protein n=1 Tax=Paenibacillus sp. PK3_47 TaxID=2072642 RepID=UPI00201DC351|nr:hypothetical protein [Paenibacillus sp. PK3_47]UQZ34666.1 hypothetical protein C2I18_14715 [Paenibacillus sp. PK3_47]
MTTIKHALVIARSELRGDRLNLVWILLWAIIFMGGYMGMMTGSMLNTVLEDGEVRLAADVMLLTFVPMLGLTFSKRTMKYLSEDTYTRILAYMRSLPVPIEVVMCKRKLQAAGSFILNGIMFFGLVYAVSSNMRQEMPFTDYLAFTLTWVGYGLTVTGLFIFFELLFSGKLYCIYIFSIMALVIGLAVLITFNGGNLFLYSISVSQEFGLLSPLMWSTLLLGTLSVQLFSKWTIHRLKSRDLV